MILEEMPGNCKRQREILDDPGILFLQANLEKCIKNIECQGTKRSCFTVKSVLVEEQTSELNEIPNCRW